MTVFYLNSATQPLTFLMVGTDHLTGVTGQSPTVRFSKAGATTFSTATQAVTEMQYGWYKLTLATNNVDTIGELAVHATATNGDDMDEKHYVGPVPANVTYWASATILTPTVAGAPLVDTGYWSGITSTATTGRPFVNVTHLASATISTAVAHLGVNVIQAATVGWLSGAIASGTFAASSIDANAMATSARDEIVDQVWDELIAAHTATTSFGAVVGANIDATISSRATTATQGPTAAVIADAVWDEVLSGHTSTGSAGDYMDRIETSATDIQTRLPAALVGGRMDSSIGNVQSAAITATGFAADAFTASGLATGAADKIADQVWDELAAGHTATTSFGAILQAISGGGATASDIFTTALPAAYAAGSAGYIIGTYLDTTVSSRSTATQGPTATVIADALLDRDMSAGTDSGSSSVRTVRQALRFLRNKWTLATTGALTIYKEDDSTTSWTATATGDSSATPITGIDP